MVLVFVEGVGFVAEVGEFFDDIVGGHAEAFGAAGLELGVDGGLKRESVAAAAEDEAFGALRHRS